MVKKKGGHKSQKSGFLKETETDKPQYFQPNRSHPTGHNLPTVSLEEYWNTISRGNAGCSHKIWVFTSKQIWSKNYSI